MDSKGELLKSLEEMLTVTDKPFHEPHELDTMVKSHTITLADKYKKSDFIVRFRNDLGYDIPVMSLGNISTTTGHAKSKKTFFSTMLLSAVVSGRAFGMLAYARGRRILFVDTEQSKYHVREVLDRIYRITKNVDNIDVISLREEPDANTRCDIVEHVIKSGKYAFVIIDGLVDLVTDYNNLEKCQLLVSKVMSWSSKYNCHINSILHLNIGSEKMRGHLGTELQNKSETVIMLEKEDDYSNVTCKASRNKEFQSFAFKIEENGLPKRDVYPNGWFNESEEKEIMPQPISNNVTYEDAEGDFLSQREPLF